MIQLRQRTLWQRILRQLSPAARRRQDLELEVAIEALMDDPSLPCMVGDHFIPNGYGTQEPRR